MGNHDAGLAMGLAANEAVRNRKSGETALSILDRICNPYRGCDAEFESQNPENPHEVHPEFDSFCDPHPKASLGMLMLEAFAPNGVGDLPRYQYMVSKCEPFDREKDEIACDAWWAEVYDKFNARYEFC